MGPTPRSEMLRTAVSWLQTAGGFAQIRTHFSPIAPADLRFSLRAEREEAMVRLGRLHSGCKLVGKARTQRGISWDRQKEKREKSIKMDKLQKPKDVHFITMATLT
jgi:hypothetical protein